MATITIITPFVVNHSQLTFPNEENPNQYLCEASDLGLAPGQWPEIILVRHDPLQDFAEMTFYQAAARYSPGPDQELISVIYTTPMGAISLEVYND